MRPHPHAADAMADAGAFVERAMLLPLPIEHLILVLNDNAVTGQYAGANYGFAFGYLPRYERPPDTFAGRHLLGGIVHEVAHYYWRGNEGWIDEGLANTIEHMHGIANGLSSGQMKAKRKDCEAHDLEMLSQWDPPVGSPEYGCNYYLGERLFLELREGLDAAEFSEKLRELYQLTLEEKASGGPPGIAAVRQVFADQAGIIDKHWSGKLNAPENRPFDEGARPDNARSDPVGTSIPPTMAIPSPSAGPCVVARCCLMKPLNRQGPVEDTQTSCCTLLTTMATLVLSCRRSRVDGHGRWRTQGIPSPPSMS